MLNNKQTHLIGAASGIAAQDHGCGDGPVALQNSPYLATLAKKGLNYAWQAMLRPQSLTAGESKYPVVVDLCERIAQETRNLSLNQQHFGVIGGDHACAIGTWSGAAAALANQGELGLIWIDAHLDSHTPQTSPSDAIHGMPVAALLGHGDPSLTQLCSAAPKVRPENLTIIGARSYEEGEYKLITDLGVRIFYMHEIAKRDLSAILQEALAIASQGTAGFGISIDLDAIDPLDAPGVGSPTARGIRAPSLLKALTHVPQQANFMGFEITEFNPHRDQKHQTEKLLVKLIEVLSER